MKHKPDLSCSVGRLLEAPFPGYRRTVRRNLARLAMACVQLVTGVGYGYGKLHLTSIARALFEDPTFKSRYKWLSRFPTCPYFD